MAKPKKTAADPSQSLETSQPRTERTVAVPLTEAVAETKPATEQSLPPRLFKAVLRLEGQLLVEDKQLLFETSDDQTRFVVSSVRGMAPTIAKSGHKAESFAMIELQSLKSRPLRKSTN